MRLRSCDSCRFVQCRKWYDIPPRGEIPAIPVREGYCHALPPRALDPHSSTFPIVSLNYDCGMHKFSLRGFLRAVGWLKKETQ